MQGDRLDGRGTPAGVPRRSGADSCYRENEKSRQEDERAEYAVGHLLLAVRTAGGRRRSIGRRAGGRSTVLPVKLLSTPSLLLWRGGPDPREGGSVGRDCSHHPTTAVSVALAAGKRGASVVQFV